MTRNYKLCRSMTCGGGINQKDGVDLLDKIDGVVVITFSVFCKDLSPYRESFVVEFLQESEVYSHEWCHLSIPEPEIVELCGE